MAWEGELRLHYRREGARTTAHDRHHGPLRVLQRLYPEGEGICHHVLVHPPGGLVGGDVLDVQIQLDPGSHALITTPGATRFYRSLGPVARQQVRARVEAGARLEWLPLETIAYDACVAENHLGFDLAPGAEMMGWDVLALGLPAANQAWERGSYLQHLELPGVWLERAQLRAGDQALFNSPLGWAGHGVLGTLWLAAGSPLLPTRGEALLEAAQAIIAAAEAAESDASPSGSAGLVAGASRTHEEVVVLRVLSRRVEPALRLLTQVWAHWRHAAWGLPACPPRVWRT